MWHLRREFWLRRLNGALFTGAVLALAVMLNVFAARHPVRWDLTREQAFTLSPATKAVLGRLQAPVRAIGFFEGGQAGRMADLMEEYTAAGGGRFSFTAVDPDQQPSLVARYQVSEFGTLVLEQGARVERVAPWDLMAAPDPTGAGTALDEEAVTRALLRLTQDRQRTVYFLQGHGEQDPEQEYFQARRALEAEGYRVLPLDLVAAGQVPDDADAIVLAGPRKDLTARESEVLAGWAGPGRGLLALVDPVPGGPLANLQTLLGRWGIALDDNLVVDPASSYRYDEAAPIPDYTRHAITAPLGAARLPMVIPRARSVRAVDGGGAVHSPLLLTTDRAWAAPAAAVAGGTVAPPAAGARGPFTLALAVEFGEAQPVTAGPPVPDAAPAAAPPPGKAVVVGSSAFAARGAVDIPGNLDFLVNAVHWVTSQPDALSIPPRPAGARNLTPTGTQLTLMLWLLVAAAPLGTVAAGTAVWWRRRYL